MRAALVVRLRRIETCDRLSGLRFLRVVRDPHFGTRLRIGQIAHRADRIRVQDVIGDTYAAQRVGDQLRFE